MRLSRTLYTLLISTIYIHLNVSQVESTAVKAGAPEKLVPYGSECFRLFHTKGDVGCRSITRSDLAALYPIKSAKELKSYLEKSPNEQESHALVVAESVLTTDAVSNLAKSKSVSGMYIYPDATHNVSFESETPQGDNTPDGILNPFSSKKIKWNSGGLNLMEVSLPFPVVLLQNQSIGEIFLNRADINQETTIDHSGAGATYTAYMNYYYGPQEMNSIDCLSFKNIYGDRHPKCDPIGGQSAWGYRGKKDADEIVIAMASMDSKSFAPMQSPGANVGASGLVALLAAAHTLRVLPDSVFTKKIMFAAFQAEKFGFVGSRNFLKDVQNGCESTVEESSSPFSSSFCVQPMITNLEYSKFNISSISAAIAVDQVGILPKNGKFSVHGNPNNDAETSIVDTILETPAGKEAKLQKSTEKTSLPPTSLTSFLNENEFGKKNMNAAVIAGYDTKYNGEGMFSSRHDILEKIDPSSVATAAQVLAESLYLLASKSDGDNDSNLAKLKVDKDLVKELLTCVTKDWGCELMANYSKPFVSSMISYLNLVETAWPSYSSPVRLYPGPIAVDQQMLVVTGYASDGGNLIRHSIFNDSWDDIDDRVRLFPNAYEFFTRSFLASTLAVDTDKNPKCETNLDCKSKGQECIYPGVCSAHHAYFHDARSPGLKRTELYNIWDVVEGAETSMPIWTEPQWERDVGSYVFPDPGAYIGWVALAIGFIITGISVFGSTVLLKRIHKMKLL